MTVITLVLLFNTAAALLYFLRNRKKGQIAWLSLFFLIVPVIGFLMYFLSAALWKQEEIRYDREYLVRRFKMAKGQSRPDMEAELDVIPVEDAMAFGENVEKRNLLLNQLKKSVHSNYRNILAAGEDTDTETAHYVAAAKMEVYHNLYEDMKNAEQEYWKDSGNMQKVAVVLDTIQALMDSEILSREENRIYKEKYCRLFADAYVKQNDNSQQEQSQEDMSDSYSSLYIEHLVSLRRFTKAEEVFTQMPDAQKSEAAYFTMLEMYYNRGMKQQFYSLLNTLCASNIIFTKDGINKVRYWLGKEEDDRQTVRRAG